MDPQVIIAAVGMAVTVAKAAMDAGQEAAPFIAALYETFAGQKEVTQADLDQLEARIDALSDEFDVPLPPADEA